MKFSEIIDQASALRQRKGRLTYRSLKLEFALDDENLDVLKDELIYGQRVAVDEDGKVLVWVGQEINGEEGPESKTENLPDARRQTLDLSAIPPRISPSVFVRLLSQRVSARQSRRCLPISKAPPR